MVLLCGNELKMGWNRPYPEKTRTDSVIHVAGRFLVLRNGDFGFWSFDFLASSINLPTCIALYTCTIPHGRLVPFLTCWLKTLLFCVGNVYPLGIFMLIFVRGFSELFVMVFMNFCNANIRKITSDPSRNAAAVVGVFKMEEGIHIRHYCETGMDFERNAKRKMKVLR